MRIFYSLQGEEYNENDYRNDLNIIKYLKNENLIAEAKERVFRYENNINPFILDNHFEMKKKDTLDL